MAMWSDHIGPRFGFERAEYAVPYVLRVTVVATSSLQDVLTPTRREAFPRHGIDLNDRCAHATLVMTIAAESALAIWQLANRPCAEVDGVRTIIGSVDVDSLRRISNIDLESTLDIAINRRSCLRFSR